MKIASIASVKAHLSAYVKESYEGPVVVTRNGRWFGRCWGWHFNLWRRLVSFFQESRPLVRQIHFLNVCFRGRCGNFNRLGLRLRRRRGGRRICGRSGLGFRRDSGNFRNAHFDRRRRYSLLRSRRSASQFFIGDPGGALEAAPQLAKALGVAVVASFGVNLFELCG